MPQSSKAHLSGKMEGLIVIVIVVATHLGNAPSAVHNPAGYEGHQGTMGILALFVLDRDRASMKSKAVVEGADLMSKKSEVLENV
jgi:hypothetical protein